MARRARSLPGRPRGAAPAGRALLALLAAVSALVVLVLPSGSGAVAQTAPPTFCPRVEPGVDAGRVADDDLDEVSGLVASRAHDGVLWALEDSGAGAELSALLPDGRDLGRHPLPGIRATDWEDLAVGPGPEPGRSYLFVGDVGDNAGGRSQVLVHRVPEPEVRPAPPGTPLDGVETLRLTYPGGPEDAEALLVDPTSGDLVIVTKQLSGRSTVLTVPAAELVPGAPIAMTEVGRLEVRGPRLTLDNATLLPGTMVTGGDVSPDGEVVLLRTYRSVLAYERPDGASLGETLLTEPCFARQVDEPQGEAIAFSASGDAYTTVSELQLARGAGAEPADRGPVLHRFDVVPPDAPLPTAPPGSGESAGRVPWWVVPLGIVAGLVLVVLVGVLLVRRRRRRRRARPA